METTTFHDASKRFKKTVANHNLDSMSWTWPSQFTFLNDNWSIPASKGPTPNTRVSQESFNIFILDDFKIAETFKRIECHYKLWLQDVNQGKPTQDWKKDTSNRPNQQRQTAHGTCHRLRRPGARPKCCSPSRRHSSWSPRLEKEKPWTTPLFDVRGLNISIYK